MTLPASVYGSFRYTRAGIPSRVAVRSYFGRFSIRTTRQRQ